jgi:hypothetical protein
MQILTAVGALQSDGHRNKDNLYLPRRIRLAQIFLFSVSIREKVCGTHPFAKTAKGWCTPRLYCASKRVGHPPIVGSHDENRSSHANDPRDNLGSLLAGA